MNKDIFMKSEKCPICGTITKQPHFKVRTYILKGTDYDLFPHYKGINPMFYGAKLCNNCGYANLSTIFDKPKNSLILKLQHEKEKNKTSWKEWILPEENDIHYAIKLHKLVLITYMNDKELFLGEIGYICLKLYWLNKVLGNEKEVDRYRKLALDNLTKCYTDQTFPICNSLDKDTTVYIVAILNYYEGNIQECKKWLSLLIKSEFLTPRMRAKITDFKLEMLK